MTGVFLHVPVASFRKGLAREFFETEMIPPPSTCYGFLLSLVGEEDREKHVGVALAPFIRGTAKISTVLRTLWRIKEPPPESGVQPGTNRRPDYQQLLTNLDIVIWLDSSEEADQEHTLEQRVQAALDPARRRHTTRFGGLSLGESTHLVDEVCEVKENGAGFRIPAGEWRAFLAGSPGSHTLPVWVDHVGTKNTRHVTGDLGACDPVAPPPLERLLKICPPE